MSQSDARAISTCDCLRNSDAYPTLPVPVFFTLVDNLWSPFVPFADGCEAG